jgi:hypothetical protein
VEQSGNWNNNNAAKREECPPLIKREGVNMNHRFCYLNSNRSSDNATTTTNNQQPTTNNHASRRRMINNE